MEKVVYKELRSASVLADNSVDTERVYDIQASVDISGNKVNGFSGGQVSKDGQSMATFSNHGINNLNVNYQVEDAATQCAITTAINSFMDAAKALVTAKSPVSL